jgi:hypothetical protein
MNTEVNRYKVLIKAKLDMLKANKQFKDAIDIFNSHILVSENNGDFNGQTANSAIAGLIADGVICIVDKEYAQSELQYKEIRIYLHTKKTNIGSKGMYNIINSNGDQ